jgi:anaerobic selenocysteine-containing dehydrogenase
MGFDDPCFRDADDDMIRALLASDHPFVRGITLEELDEKHSVRLRVASDGEPFLPFAEGGFGTPSGNCEFRAEDLDYTPPVESRHGGNGIHARYPFELISPKSDDGLNSTFGNRADAELEASVLTIHPEDAARREISSGDRVRVFNDRGSCLLAARVENEVKPGVVAARSVRWNKVAPDRRNVNVLTSDRLTDAGGGPIFYSCLVQIEKCGD